MQPYTTLHQIHPETANATTYAPTNIHPNAVFGKKVINDEILVHNGRKLLATVDKSKSSYSDKVAPNLPKLRHAGGLNKASYVDNSESQRLPGENINMNNPYNYQSQSSISSFRYLFSFLQLRTHSV